MNVAHLIKDDTVVLHITIQSPSHIIIQSDIQSIVALEDDVVAVDVEATPEITEVVVDMDKDTTDTAIQLEHYLTWK